MDTAATPNLGPGLEGDAAHPTPSEMEISEQVSTYRFFNGLVKWGSLAVAVVVLFLTLLFCAHTGFIPAAVVSLVVLVAGLVGLRGKVAADPVHSPS
jgi:hypothetical protein